MNRQILFLGTAFAALSLTGSTLASAPKKPTENKQAEKQEFGAHERPWAKDYLAKQSCEAASEPGERSPGLLEAKEKVEDRLQNPNALAPAPLNAALTDTTAAMTAIRQERKRLETEWRELEDARALLELASRRTHEEMAALSKLRTEVSGLIDELETRESENVERIAELVKNLSAKDASRLLATRDPEFILEVLDVLDSRLAADVLGKMEEWRAEEVMALIATRGRPKYGDPKQSL